MMETSFDRKHSGRFFFGLVLLVLGSLYLLHNLGYVYVGPVSRYWPALFILFGLARLLDYDGTAGRHTGIGWIFFGSWLLVSLNGWFDLDFHNSWPILLIGWGASLLWKGIYTHPEITTTEEIRHGI